MERTEGREEQGREGVPGGGGEEGAPSPGGVASAGFGPVAPFALLVVLAVLAVFGRTWGHGFIDFDDTGYVTRNPVVLEGLTAEGVRWAFTTFHMANWHPLAWLSHMADVELFGAAPAGHHAVNVLLHAANAVLLLLLLHRLTGSAGASALAALLFAVHPLRVESVAWVSERKDLLCAAFVFLSLLSWCRHAAGDRGAPGGTGGGGGAGLPGRPYFLALAFHALALLAKPMAVSLPILLLLLDAWPFRRFARVAEGAGGAAPLPPWRLLAEKVPFVLLSVLSGAATLVAQEGAGAMGRLDEFPLADRLGNAVVSAAAYLGKAAWPSSLSFFYPHPTTLGDGVAPWKVAAGGAVLVALSLLAWRERRRRPWLAFGWLWYLATLAPVAGIVQVGSQAMADRYTYLPLAGVALAAALAGEEAVRRSLVPRPAALSAAAAAVLLLAFAAWRQAGYWKDSPTLYARAVAVTERNWLAMNNLGEALSRRGDLDGAERWYREAMRLFPSDPVAWNNLGTVLDLKGRVEEALAAYREATRLSPPFQMAWVNQGVAYRKLGRTADAEAALREALRLDPRDGGAWNTLGMMLAREGRPAEAVDAYRQAIDANPRDALPHYNLGLALDRLGDPARAEESYRAALRIRPAFPEAWVNLGTVQAKQGRHGEAVESVEEALRLRPGDPVALGILSGLRDGASPAP